jgi:hypothetical protein
MPSSAVKRGNRGIATCNISTCVNCDNGGTIPHARFHYSNEWRIEVSEGANSDGEIVFHVTPEGGTTHVVKAVVENGTSENQVARVIERAFEAQLGDGKYEIQVDDGEDVLVKKHRAEPVFALQLASSTVKSVRLEVEKE